MSEADDSPNSMPKPLHLAPLDELGIKPSSVNLAAFIDSAHKAFVPDTTNALPAFDVLSYVVSAHWRSENAEPKKMVEVPFWALEVIVIGFLQYLDAAKAGRTTTFGEAYGLEGGGQGKRPRIKEHLQTLRNRNIAWSVAILIERDNFAVERAVTETAERYQLSAASVWSVWRNLGAQAQESIRNFLSLKSS